jgi:predicted ATP-grasp superfamily ATP-dependent carboligase
LPVPLTFFAGTQADIERIGARVPYPAILKPAYSPAWMRAEFQARLGEGAGGFIKRIVINSPAELAATYAEVSRYDPEVVVQDLIVGGDDHLVDVYAYLGDTGRVLAQFAIQKLRVLPIDGNGVGTCVRTIEVPELERIAVRFLESVGYRGNAAVCFKKDARDGRHYCIEVNARLALHHALATACGVDLALMGYQEALGRAPREQNSPLPRRHMKWVTLRDDFRAALRYRRRGSLSLWGWLRSLAGSKSFVHWAWDDPGPACVRFLLTCAAWRPLEQGPLAVFRRGFRAAAHRVLTRKTAGSTQAGGLGIEEGPNARDEAASALVLAGGASTSRRDGARSNLR